MNFPILTLLIVIAPSLVTLVLTARLGGLPGRIMLLFAAAWTLMSFVWAGYAVWPNESEADPAFLRTDGMEGVARTVGYILSAIAAPVVAFVLTALAVVFGLKLHASRGRAE